MHEQSIDGLGIGACNKDAARAQAARLKIIGDTRSQALKQPGIASGKFSQKVTNPTVPRRAEIKQSAVFVEKNTFYPHKGSARRLFGSALSSKSTHAKREFQRPARRHPAARASASLQNQRWPLLVLIRVAS